MHVFVETQNLSLKLEHYQLLQLSLLCHVQMMKFNPECSVETNLAATAAVFCQHKTDKQMQRTVTQHDYQHKDGSLACSGLSGGMHVTQLRQPPGSDVVVACTAKRQLMMWHHNPEAAFRTFFARQTW